MQKAPETAKAEVKTSNETVDEKAKDSEIEKVETLDPEDSKVIVPTTTELAEKEKNNDSENETELSKILEGNLLGPVDPNLTVTDFEEVIASEKELEFKVPLSPIEKQHFTKIVEIQKGSIKILRQQVNTLLEYVNAQPESDDKEALFAKIADFAKTL